LFGNPPEIVPEGLSAREYYELGLWYEETHNLSQARLALTRAIAADPAGDVGQEARRFLNARVPLHDLPKEAVESLARAELLLAIKPAQARKTAARLINEYPDFEWPLRLLAQVCLNEGDLDKCVEHCRQALEINPDYAQAVGLLARAAAVDMDYPRAGELLERALFLAPDDDELRRFQRSLEFVMTLEQDPGS
jgi:tetratricopeptide (TPR) repeat protein